MKVLALNGWAQKAESIRNVLPEGAEIVGYGDCASVETVFKRMQEAHAEPDVLFGWSLGGQLSVRAVAAGIIRPKRLVLMGAPYQLVSDREFKGGVNKAVVMASRLALATNAEFMLKEFQGTMLAQGDSLAATVRAEAKDWVAGTEGMEWMFWFDELAHFSCRHLDFGGFPPTDIIHGDGDAVIPFGSAEAFHARIAGSTLHRMKKCGHAPHWHDANFVKTVITGA